MAKNFADLKAAIDANTAATKAVVAAFPAGANTDFTAQVDAIAANTDALNALAPASTVPAGSVIVASPASISLPSKGGSATVSLSQPATVPPGPAPIYDAVSANTAIATVSPASGVGPFTVTEIAPGSTSIAFTDAQGNTISVPVIAA